MTIQKIEKMEKIPFIIVDVERKYVEVHRTDTEIDPQPPFSTVITKASYMTDFKGRLYVDGYDDGSKVNFTFTNYTLKEIY